MDRDVWARLERDGTVTLGMTDPAQTRCGKVVQIEQKLTPGQSQAVGQNALGWARSIWNDVLG